jgi:hypothetical protein
VSHVLALVRFQTMGYVRSLRALQPLIAIVLLISIMFADTWASPSTEALVSAFADMAALMVPIWALAAQATFDVQPEEQGDLSAVAAGSRIRWITAGLLTAYVVNLGLGVIGMGWLLAIGVDRGAGAGVLLLGVALHVIAAVPATLIGAWTCRSFLPRPAVSVLSMLFTCVAALLLSLGPLHWISVPMGGWMRAASDGQQTFAAAFPGVAVHTLLWSAVVGAGYVWRRTRRP